MPLKTVRLPSLYSKRYSSIYISLLSPPPFEAQNSCCPAAPRSPQFDETVNSEASAELVGDGFAEVAAAIVADYEAKEMPMPGNEDFAPMFKKWIKVLPAVA